MATIRRNILANFAGGTWTAILTIIITPLQVNILGMEAYGLVGFIATLQILFSVLDLGLSSTLTRELAGDNSSGRTRSLPLLQTAATIYWALAVVIGLTLTGLSGSIARTWFHSKAIDPAVLRQGLRVI